MAKDIVADIARMVGINLRPRTAPKPQKASKRPAPTAGSGFVYFIQRSDGGPIKIGWAKDVRARVAKIQTGVPETLAVLATMPGTTRTERSVHGLLAAHRCRRGEWFNPAPEVLEVVERVRAGLVLPAA